MATSIGQTPTFESLWNLVSAPFLGQAAALHGPEHWRRVERNGLLLATQTNANFNVVRLFALFHDSRRLNDGWDPGHGARGAEFAANLRGTAFQLTDDEFALLHYACVWHTEGKTHQDATIATCWDADGWTSEESASLRIQSGCAPISGVLWLRPDRTSLFWERHLA